VPTFIRPARVQVDTGSGLDLTTVAALAAVAVIVAGVASFIAANIAAITDALAITVAAGATVAAGGIAYTVRVLRRDGLWLSFRPAPAIPAPRVQVIIGRVIREVPAPTRAQIEAREAARTEALGWALRQPVTRSQP
jgi:hypothetical protein